MICSEEKPNILIVDDASVNIHVLAKLLGEDYSLKIAKNGLTALKIASMEKLDLILLDIMMPEMDGYEVCRQLKSDDIMKEIPVIFITAKTEDKSETQGLELGAVDYITKPFNPKIVKLRVKNQIQLKRQQDILSQMSFIDGLTQISNRRAFDEYLDREWKRAIRKKSSISMLLMDIDYFKNYNDNYGHIAGDDCLRKIACELLNIHRRPGDMFSRYGGEEFASILTDTDLDGAKHMASKMLKRISELKIPHEFSPVTDHVTISIGVANFHPDQGMTHDQLIQNADRLLYQAKDHGRNRMEYQETPC
jgi:diguanylate cyclase (GGDEF)-like protein